LPIVPVYSVSNIRVREIRTRSTKAGCWACKPFAFVFSFSFFPGAGDGILKPFEFALIINKLT
jgi:hypothetical protein